MDELEKVISQHRYYNCSGEGCSVCKRIASALSEAGMVMLEDVEIDEEKVFNVLRYNCASEKCEPTCPAYQDKSKCGIWIKAHAIALAHPLKRKEV
jgi:hypothetical protein